MYLALEISTVLFPEGLLGYRALESKAKKNDENFYILSYSLAQFHLPPHHLPWGLSLRNHRFLMAFQRGVEQSKLGGQKQTTASTGICLGLNSFIWPSLLDFGRGWRQKGRIVGASITLAGAILAKVQQHFAFFFF